VYTVGTWGASLSLGHAPGSCCCAGGESPGALGKELQWINRGAPLRQLDTKGSLGGVFFLLHKTEPGSGRATFFPRLGFGFQGSNVTDRMIAQNIPSVK